MPTFGGFYVCPAAWREWVHVQGPPTDDLPWGSLYAEAQIHLMLRQKKLNTLYRVRAVPIPASERQEHVYALIVYNRNSRRPMYFPPRSDVKAERDGKDILRNELGLTTTEYRSLWFDENATIEPYCCQFLDDPRPWIVACLSGYRKWLLPLTLAFGTGFIFLVYHQALY